MGSNPILSAERLGVSQLLGAHLGLGFILKCVHLVVNGNNTVIL
jgi:hypothetical protein